VYIVEDVARNKARTAPTRREAPLADYVVDARTGALVASLPRAPTLARRIVTASDGSGRRRRIAVEAGRRRKRMRDAALNIVTYAFGFRDVEAANATDVARFLREVLKRNNIDGAGGPLVSSIDCCDRSEATDTRGEWRNACWDPGEEQMLYGQVAQRDGSFYSIANMPEIVGHEMFHGVTDATAKLEYVRQSGALNESYSDVFGVMVANRGRPLARWSWRIGVGFHGEGTVLRDMKDPERVDDPQAKTMKEYERVRVPDEDNDYGWVHFNSGIHNYAAYRIMTAKTGGRFLFRPQELAALFFVALTERLSRTSQFTDSRRAVVQTAQSLFRRDAPARRAAKLRAIEAGFAAAGIR
jgi:Zn-dependent metalloprotease